MPINDNSSVDGDRTINLTLSNPQNGLTLGSPASAVLTIIDDEIPPSEHNETLTKPGTISIESAKYSVNEDVGTLNIKLVRDSMAGGTSVDLLLLDDTAEFNRDYTALVNGVDKRTIKVNFAEGETYSSTTLIINDDASAEVAETFTVAIINPQGGASLGSTTRATVTINDNDPGNPNGDAANNAAGAIHPGFLLALLLAGAAWRRRPSIG